jgi:uncharacterized protein (TIGR02271 family)
VRNADRTQEAEQIITANNGSVRHEDTGVTGAREPASATAGTEYATGQSATSQEGLDRVQLFGEVLRVHKDRVQRGEVRLHKDVVTENQTMEVPVTREELVMERVDVTGDRSAPDASIGSGEDIRIPLTEERVRLEKRPVVREEMLVGKREVTDSETLSDSTRHEELRVDGDNVEGKRTGEENRPENIRRPA